MKRNTAQKNCTGIRHIFLDSYPKLVMYHALVSYINSWSRSVCGKIFILLSLFHLSQMPNFFQITSFEIIVHLSDSDPHHSSDPGPLHPIFYFYNSIVVFCFYFLFKDDLHLLFHIKYAFPCFKLFSSTWKNFLAKLIYFLLEGFIFFISMYLFYFFTDCFFTITLSCTS